MISKEGLLLGAFASKRRAEEFQKNLRFPSLVDEVEYDETPEKTMRERSIALVNYAITARCSVEDLGAGGFTSGSDEDLLSELDEYFSGKLKTAIQETTRLCGLEVSGPTLVLSRIEKEAVEV